MASRKRPYTRGEQAEESGERAKGMAVSSLAEVCTWFMVLALYLDEETGEQCCIDILNPKWKRM